MTKSKFKQNKLTKLKIMYNWRFIDQKSINIQIADSETQARKKIENRYGIDEAKYRITGCEIVMEGVKEFV